METSGGILGRLGEKVLGWIALALLIALGVGIWQLGPDGRGAILSALGRAFLWLVIASAVPWSVQLFIKPLLEVGANWVGVVAIGALVLVDAIAGVWLMGGFPSGGWAWLATLAALALAGTYNYFVAEYLAEQAGG